MANSYKAARAQYRGDHQWRATNYFTRRDKVRAAKRRETIEWLKAARERTRARR